MTVDESSHRKDEDDVEQLQIQWEQYQLESVSLTI